MLTELPITKAGTVLCQELFPETTVPPGEKRPSWTSISLSIMGHFLGALTVVSLHGDYNEICRFWLLNLNVMKRWERLATTSTLTLVGQVPTCSTQAVVPTSSFNHLQSKVRDTLWPGNPAVCKYAWFWFSNKGLFAPGTRSVPT